MTPLPCRNRAGATTTTTKAMPDNDQISRTLKHEAELAGAFDSPTAGCAQSASAPAGSHGSLGSTAPTGSTHAPSSFNSPNSPNSPDLPNLHGSPASHDTPRSPSLPGTNLPGTSPADAACPASSSPSPSNGSNAYNPVPSTESRTPPRRFTPDYSAVLPQAPSPEADAEQNHPGRKRLFIGLICGTSLLLCVIMVLGWGVPYVGFENIHPSVPYITGTLLVLVILFIGWAALSLVLQVITGKVLFGTKKARGVTVKLFLPLMEFSGRFIGIAPKDVRRSFIQVNNELVESAAKRYSPDKLLILLPHCIQWSGCNLRVSSRLERCKRCGNCCVGSLLELTDKYGVSMAIATGGTIARRIVVQKRPRLIIAIACERDLASGIQDTHPLPVYGILNQRPHGPCVDTLVALPDVEKALRRFIRPEDLPEN